MYLVVSYIGNKIVDKGGDAIENALKRKKMLTMKKWQKIWQIVFIIDLAQTSTIGNQKIYKKRRFRMMFCPNCRTENLEDAKFCVSCGKPLSSGNTAETTSGSNISSSGIGPAVGPDSYRQLGGWQY